MNKLPFFKDGGALAPNSPSYLTRDADDIIFETLMKKEYANIISPRQMGKSSLIQKVVAKLEEEVGFITFYFDLTVAIMSITEKQLYGDILLKLCTKLNIKFNSAKYKDRLINSPAHIVFQEFVTDLDITNQKSLVIFLDEIDALFRANVNKDLTVNLFSTIRSLYNNRSISSNLNKIVFCMAGVLPPNKLLDDPYSTPFNIGTSIQLGFIEKKKYNAYKGRFRNFKGDEIELIDQIYYWCNGHPYLTQYLCKVIEEKKNEYQKFDIDPRSFVNYIVTNYLLTLNKTKTINTHFSTIQEHIAHGEYLNRRAIELYRKIYSGEIVRYNYLNETHEFLKTSGLLYDHGNNICISNKIYQSFFNEDWIKLMENKFDRPFNNEYIFWLDSGLNPDSAFISGKNLEVLIDWTKSRNDITSDEMEFLEQCRNNETKRIYKRYSRVFYFLGSVIIFILLLLFILQYLNKSRTYEIETVNKTRINDFTEILQLLQENKNPRKMIQKVNEFKNKNHNLYTLQIQCINTIINKIPFDTIFIDKNKLDNLRIKTHLDMLSISASSKDSFSISDDKNSILHFSYKNHNNIESIRFPNMIKDYISSEKYLITLCFDGKFYFHDLITGYEFSINSDISPKNVIEFSFTNNNIFSVTSDLGYILKYNLGILAFDKETLPLSGISAFYKKNGIEVVGNFSGELILTTKDVIIKLKGHKGGISAIDYSEKFKIIATSSYDHTIKLWNLKGDILDSMFSENDGILDMKFLNDEYKVIVACKNNNLYLWNLQNHQYKSFKGHKRMVQSFDITKDSKLLVSGGRDSSIIIWDIEKGKEIREIKNTDGWITDIEIAKKSNYFISSTNKSITMWNLNGDSIRSFIGQNDCIWDICFINNENNFISGSWDNSFCIWNTNGDVISLFKGNSSNISNIWYDENLNKIYLAFYDGEMRAYKF